MNKKFRCNDVSSYNALSKISSFSDMFRVYHMNVERVPRLDKFDKLKHLVDSLSTKPMILCFVETWFVQAETGENSGGDRSLNPYILDGYQTVFVLERNVVRE